MKRFAAALFVLCLTCAVPAGATSYAIHIYKPEEVQALEKSAREGDVKAMLTLGAAYDQGRVPGKVRDRASALLWFGKAANLGNAVAQREIGELYADDDPKRAFLWFQRAAEKGDVLAQGRLARIYETSATLKDYSKGYEWSLKAALQGDPNAADRVRTLYVYGDDVASFDAAMARLSLAADAGDKGAQWRLATVLLISMIAPQDAGRGKVLAEKAASQNSPEGLYLLANYVPPGTATLTDAELAARIGRLRRAADMGYVPAQIEWMGYYETSAEVDIAQDPNERLIFDWLAAAAEKGWPIAQNALSHYYERGLFVAQDGAEAHKWLLLAHHLPFNRGGFNRGFDPWTEPVEHEWQAEGRRRAEDWLKAHSKLYWQTEE